MQQPIFIIGTQRSGTTLLTRMLSAHPGLFIQNEMGTYGVFDKPYTTEVLHGRITGRLRDRYSVNVNSLESEGVLWGWKDPMLTPHLDELAEHYPDSKFIVIYTPGGWDHFIEAWYELTDEQKADEAFVTEFLESYDEYYK